MDHEEEEKENVKHYQPRSMLVVYSCNNTLQTKYYVETHQIHKGKPGPGKPVSLETISELKASLSMLDGKQLKAISGIIPPNLIYMDSDPLKQLLIWWTPAQHRKLYFDQKQKVKNGKAFIPRLLYILEKTELSVFVLQEDPTMKSKVYYAPFPNVHYEDDVCMGNVEMEFETSDMAKIMKMAESAFLNSSFNTVHDEKLCNVDIHTMWDELIKTQAPFDNKVLVHHEEYKTLKDLINAKEN